MSDSTTTAPALQALLDNGWTQDAALAHVEGTCDRVYCTAAHSDDPASILADLIHKALAATSTAATKAAFAYHRGTPQAQADQDAAEAQAAEANAAMWGVFYDLAGNL